MSSLSFQSKTFFPQALSTGLHSRISKDPDNSLILNTAPQGRSAKRNAQQINYAEFENLNDDYDFEDIPTSTNTTNAVVNNHLGSTTQKHLLKHARTTRYPEALDDESYIEEVARQSDILIPIRLNLEYNNGNSKLVDFFMWNINEALISIIEKNVCYGHISIVEYLAASTKVYHIA